MISRKTSVKVTCGAILEGGVLGEGAPQAQSREVRGQEAPTSQGVGKCKGGERQGDSSASEDRESPEGGGKGSTQGGGR